MKSQIEIHQRENNAESEQHLSENRHKFSEQCLLVLRLLNSGLRLTVVNAIGYGIGSLPRRLLDLKEHGVTNIKDEWVRNSDGKRLYKEWFIPDLRPPTKEKVIEKAKGFIQTQMF